MQIESRQDAAVRLNAETRAEERLEHVPTPRGHLYCWTSRPETSGTCVLICSSLFGDFTANYHRERLLGRALAMRGYGVMRFHYAGEGNSSGDRRDVTFLSLCEDASAVLSHGTALGFKKFAFLGTRVGALVAASTAASLPSVPLALWEPVTEPLRFITDAQRAKKISQTAKGLGDGAADWREELSQKGVLDLLGYDIYSPLIDSLEGVNLLKILGPPPRNLFLARFGGKPGSAPPLADNLARIGFVVESGTYGPSESWWFHSEVAPETGGLIAATTDWFMKVLAEEP